MGYIIQVYNGDVGGIDEDFEADTLEDARRVAGEETLPGTRGTQILDSNYNLIETVES